VPAGWRTFRDDALGFSFGHPPDFVAIGALARTDRSHGIIVGTDQSISRPETAPTFAYISVIPIGASGTDELIYNYSAVDTEGLLRLAVGESLDLRGEASSQSSVGGRFVYTRLVDAVVGDAPARAYVNRSPWESPPGTEEHRRYVERGDRLYLFGAYLQARGPVSAGVVDLTLFARMLATVRFVGGDTGAGAGGTTGWS